MKFATKRICSEKNISEEFEDVHEYEIINVKQNILTLVKLSVLTLVIWIRKSQDFPLTLILSSIWYISAKWFDYKKAAFSAGLFLAVYGLI